MAGSRVPDAMDLVADDMATNLLPFPRFPCTRPAPVAALPCARRDHREILFEIADVADRAQLCAPLDKGAAQITGTLLAILIKELLDTAT